MNFTKNRLTRKQFESFFTVMKTILCFFYCHDERNPYYNQVVPPINTGIDCIGKSSRCSFHHRDDSKYHHTRSDNRLKLLPLYLITCSRIRLTDYTFTICINQFNIFHQIKYIYPGSKYNHFITMNHFHR